ncbi:MAG: hypothetical protein QM795_08365 [Pseudoxanthomonas sp.]
MEEPGVGHAGDLQVQATGQVGIDGVRVVADLQRAVQQAAGVIVVVVAERIELVPPLLAEAAADVPDQRILAVDEAQVASWKLTCVPIAPSLASQRVSRSWSAQ